MRRSFFVLIALAVASSLAYQPAWHGGILWDDAGHLTRPDLRPGSGLWRIWFTPGATQQYYPVVHSAFWVFHRLWGDSTTGYHLANILLHATSAWLLWRLLLRIEVRGALLAAAIFALHPVHVESVAWITELKNVLSTTFYLAAALVYLRFDVTRQRSTYVGALTLFALAVSSKTVTGTLPAALLVLFWWQRGRLRLREDIGPLVPLFVLGLTAGLVTVWFERTLIGAQGSEFALSWIERVLLAGRVVWFYLFKLAWPTGLVFIYPRWSISAADPTQWLYPIALLVTLAGAWLVRTRTRGPLATLLLFLIGLFPALGFFDVYPFRFSFVADHFQYLASIPVIAGFAAAVVHLAFPAVRVTRSARHESALSALAIAMVAVLAVLTWRQAHLYADASTLYRETVRRNPGAWLAHNNLAAVLLEGDPSRDRIDEAIDHLHAALRLEPDYPQALFNLGTAFERLGRRDEAAEQYKSVLRLDPGERRALERLQAVNYDRASALLEEGLRAEKQGRPADAARAFEAATTLDPSRALAYECLGRVRLTLGQLDASSHAYERALDLDPRSFETHNDLGFIRIQQRRVGEALEHFEAALAIRPGDPIARGNVERARALMRSR